MTKGFALNVPQLKLVETRAGMAAVPAPRPLPCKFEALLSPPAQPHDFVALLLPTPPPERFDWLALTKVPPRHDFRLAARLSSAQALNAPKHRRDGKGPVTPPNFGKPAQSKAKPKAPQVVAKKSQPVRHVWLSARPEARKGADIIRFQPRGARSGLTHAA